MTLQAFVAGVLENAARVKEYCLGMDGANGRCDCIGLIMGGIRLAGGQWKGTHGSNYAARQEMQSLEKVTSARQLQPGQMVFKARCPGETGYALPAAYRAGVDLNDYYHVGMVESAVPLQIVHCTSVPGGIRRDTSLGNWQYAGLWKGIEPETVCKYRVVGGRLNMRTGPGSHYPVSASLPDGAVVEGRPVDGNAAWLCVSWQGKKGYCMSRYLAPADADEQPLEKLSALLQQAQALVSQLAAKE